MAKKQKTIQPRFFDEDLFKQYKQVSSRLGKNIPRTLRLFDIKFRLALGIIVDFDDSISFTKDTITKETYISMVKLVELWNAYESFIIFANEIFFKNSKKKVIFFNDNTVNTPESKKILNDALVTLKKYYNESEGFKRDFDEFVQRMEKKGIDRGDTKKIEKLKKLQNYLTTGSARDVFSVIELIYLHRNLFYHTGETARIGAKNLRNRKKTIDLCHKTLADYMLSVSINIIPKVADEIKKLKMSTVTNENLQSCAWD